jgi:oxalate decarboxylase
MPPVTDRGVIMPIWYSFDLTHRRIQDGGWTRQVTARELPSSQDLAGVTMRLTAGSYRELHWRTANEWAYMLYGNARVTVFNPEDGTIFIGDVAEGDLWFFPTGFPHSIQGLGPDGCEFLLVFDQGMFSEYTTSLLSGWLAHTPAKVASQNFNIPEAQSSGLPEQGLYIFPGTVPGPLEDDRKAVGGSGVASKIDYTFRMKSMKPTAVSGGTIRVVDSKIFPASEYHRGRSVSHETGSPAGASLAPQCLGVAVLHRGQRPDDDVRLGGSGAHHGLQTERRRLCSPGCRPLRREYGK